ncbi:hypothetical protein BT93_K1296 [Corymbia citriodora subsp. variegata]|nr:hypothetical protein BT93_K1296 [Corymbia citriodora subsp. variegata]KAF8007252.1 hypothetical protein BT93_K1296 [Corymbia citriodora subsp. variegata]
MLGHLRPLPHSLLLLWPAMLCCFSALLWRWVIFALYRKACCFSALLWRQIVVSLCKKARNVLTVGHRLQAIHSSGSLRCGFESATSISLPAQNGKPHSSGEAGRRSNTTTQAQEATSFGIESKDDPALEQAEEVMGFEYFLR